MVDRVLVVEDDSDLRTLVEFKLLKRGFEATTVADGKSALELLKQEKFDVVILDLMLPKLSGFQVLRQLLEELGSLPAKFIVVSAMSNEEDILQALNLGVSEYMVKPFSLEVLVAQVRKLLGKLPGQIVNPDSA